MNRAFSKILVLVILIILVGGGILAYQYWWLPKEEAKISETKPPEVKAPEEVPPEETPEDETADWNIYRNGEYGFQIKYPKDWQVEISTVKSIKINKPVSGSYFEIIENKNEKNLTLDEWFKELTIIDGRPTLKASARETSINGVKAYKLDSELEPSNPLFEIVGIANTQRRIFTLYAYVGQLDDNIILEEILSTFRFIEKEETECDKWREVCAKESEIRCSPCGCRECCPGLTSRDVTYPWRTENNEVVCLEEMTTYICVNCGDGICGKGESWCVCSEDCSKPNPRDLELFKGKETVDIEVFIETKSFDLNNKTFEGRTRAENTNIKVLTTDSTEFYRGAYDEEKFIIDNYYTFPEFYSLLKNWSGPDWPFTVKGILEDENVIRAYEVFIIAQ